MARLHTSGFESNDLTLEGFSTAVGTGVTIQQSVVRSGNYVLRCDANPGGVKSVTSTIFTSLADGGTVFIRGYFCFATLGAAVGSDIISLQNATSPSIHVAVTLDNLGRLSLYGTNIGSHNWSSALITADSTTFYRIELSVTYNSASNDLSSFKVDGTTIDTISHDAFNASFPLNQVQLGWAASPPISGYLYLDDVAINDDTGTNQNSWPGAGAVMLALPSSDTIRDALWTAGAGGTTNLWDAVNNTPPVGVASANETNTTNIEHAGNAAGLTNTYEGISNSLSSLGISGKNVGYWSDDVSTPGILGFGYSTTAERLAQKFTATGPISSVEVYIGRIGIGQTDQVTVAIQGDASGSPNGTDIVSASFSPFLTVQQLPGLAANLTNGTTYWVVFRRTGSNDAANYYTVGKVSSYSGAAPGGSDTYVRLYDSASSTWGGSQLTDNIAVNIQSATDSAMPITLCQMIAVAGEDIATGSKLLRMQSYNPWTPADASWDVFPGNIAHGVYPSNWTVKRSTINYSPRVFHGFGSQVRIIRPETAARAACVCFLGVLIEYVPTQTHSVTGSITPSTAVGSAASLLYQYLRPTVDTSNSNWIGNAGETTNLYAKLNETVANDATYIQATGTGATYRTKVTAAQAATPMIVHLDINYGRTSLANKPSITVKWYQGNTLILSETFILPNFDPSIASYTYDYDAATLGDLITDWSDVYLEIVET